MSKSIIPIGKSLGANHNSRGVLESYEWVRGDDILDLTPEEAVTLNFVYANHDEHFHHRFDRAAYLKYLKEQSTTLSDSEITSLVNGLLSKGVLAEADLRGSDVEPFLRTYRVLPVGQSFGNSKERPEQFGIGGAEPVVFVSGWTQVIWALSHVDGSIWRGCELQAAEVPDTSAMELARDFAAVLPVMVSTGCAALEKI